MNNNVPRFGVNYVPSGAWWYAWMDWNGAQIQDNLEQIASLGMDHIRIHCLWHLFQPNPNRTSEIALTRLYELLDIADKCKLDVQITVLDGWLSGFSFFPAWKRPNPEGQGLNLFTDPGMIAAEQFLFSSIAKALINLRRVSFGEITSSIKPLAAARYGFANFSAYSRSFSKSFSAGFSIPVVVS